MKTHEQMLDVLAEQVDRAITIATRHTYAWGLETRLWEALVRQSGEFTAMAAARRLKERLVDGDVVVFAAGFVKLPYHAQGETDGMAGSAALARAVSLGLGAKAMFVTDEPCVGPLRAVAQAAELRIWDEAAFAELPPYLCAQVRPFPVDHEAAKAEAERLLDTYPIKAVVGVERSDANEKGVHHTGGGNTMDAWTGKTEHLFQAARRRGILTIGAFDVGNEIGGAAVRDLVRELVVPFGKECRCGCGGGIAGVTPTDVSVVGRSSNAAAYGIAACVAGLVERQEVLHDATLQRAMMETLMRYPIADGPTRTNTFTEDGAPGELTLDLIDLLHWLVHASILGERYLWSDRHPPRAGDR